jgi:hypothetical protein
MVREEIGGDWRRFEDVDVDVNVNVQVQVRRRMEKET